MKKVIYILFFLPIIGLSQTKNISEIKEPYLGQKPPGTTPEVFAPGIVSSKEYVESNCLIWDKGNHILFFRIDVGKLETSNTANGWESPTETVEWGGPTLLHFISPDGKTMYYNYFGHVPSGTKARTSPLFVKHKLNDKWSKGEDTQLGGMWASADNNNNLYYTTHVNGLASIGKSTVTDGKYSEKEVVSLPNEEKNEYLHPCVAHDGSFLIFDTQSNDPENIFGLYISFKQKDNNWTKPTSMRKFIPFKSAAMARLSSDGKYIFFQAEGDIYWVSAKIIEELKSKCYDYI